MLSCGIGRKAKRRTRSTVQFYDGVTLTVWWPLFTGLHFESIGTNLLLLFDKTDHITKAPLVHAISSVVAAHFMTLTKTIYDDYDNMRIRSVSSDAHCDGDIKAHFNQLHVPQLNKRMLVSVSGTDVSDAL